MKEEDKILKKIGTDNPFTVPEGYFENLTSQVMNQLPEQKKQDFQIKKPTTRWDRIKPWTYMAAMFAGAALLINIGKYNPNPFEDSNDLTAGNEIELISDEDLDFSLSQSMFDDYSLYVYLSE
jgi:hypothetical protein